MSEDPDLTYQPRHLSFDEAAAEYAAHESFIDDAIQSLAGSDPEIPLPDDLQAALVRWYQGTDDYTAGVQHFLEEAAQP